MSELMTILKGDALEKLRELPDESVHCCVTSPPYWGLRDYSAEGQLGLEKTPAEYVEKMVKVFREVRRVLRKDGTLWLNLGDSYTSTSGNLGYISAEGKTYDDLNNRGINNKGDRIKNLSGLKPKDLCGIPWRVAFALQADGWWLRSDVIEEVELYCPCGCGYVMQERIWRHAQDREIIWKKPNPMPESVTDRPTKSHEYVFLLSKSANYFYDAEAIREPHTEPWRGNGEVEKQCPKDSAAPGLSRASQVWGVREYNPAGRNKRSVWTIATQPYPEAHFATFPEELPKLCILAGTSAKGCCAKCGGPWERITEKGEVLSIGGSSDENRLKARIADSGPMERRNADGSSASQFSHQIVHRENKTLGWQPTCVCEYKLNDWMQHYGSVPCTVLDPFAGSGTTGMMALELGRKAVLIELNPTYAKLIDQRCDVTPGLQLC